MKKKKKSIILTQLKTFNFVSFLNNLTLSKILLYVFQRTGQL